MVMSDSSAIRLALMTWYRQERRDLPWRRTRDPYAIWVSEVMLQQTQVSAVLPYYERWMTRFPTVHALAEASEEQVLAVWQGLGYYRRAKLLRQGAIYVSEQGFPQNAEEWRRVPGVGPYTAAAIASIAFGVPAAVVDGNVERVFARLAGCGETGEALLRLARTWAEDILDRGNPGDWNQALMDLGATVCTFRKPKCEACPVSEHCIARQSWTVDRYPAASSKPKTVRRTLRVMVPFAEGLFGIRRVAEGGWWEGMWEFPSSFSDSERSGQTEGWQEDLPRFACRVTNHRIEVVPFLIRPSARDASLTWLAEDELRGLPMPSPQRRVLRYAKKALGLVE
jgi:A/G-specific adenine glycosylase